MKVSESVARRWGISRGMTTSIGKRLNIAWPPLRSVQPKKESIRRDNVPTIYSPSKFNCNLLVCATATTWNWNVPRLRISPPGSVSGLYCYKCAANSLQGSRVLTLSLNDTASATLRRSGLLRQYSGRSLGLGCFQIRTNIPPIQPDRMHVSTLVGE